MTVYWMMQSYIYITIYWMMQSYIYIYYCILDDAVLYIYIYYCILDDAVIYINVCITMYWMKQSYILCYDAKRIKNNLFTWKETRLLVKKLTYMYICMGGRFVNIDYWLHGSQATWGGGGKNGIFSSLTQAITKY